MKKLTRKIVALTLSLVMCISFSNESLDYFEAAYAHNNGAAYPNIQDYQ